MLLFLLFWVSSLPVVKASDSSRQLAHDADIYLVPVGSVPTDVMRNLAQRYRDIAQLKVEIVGQLPLPDVVVDPIRKQLIAEKLQELMVKVLGDWKHKPFALVVGITPYDMYIAGSEWRYAYAYGQGQYALVSAARMSDGESTDTHWSNLLSTRVQKMLDKRIAIQLFGMGAWRTIPDVLARPVLGPDDLDHIDAQSLTEILRGVASTSVEPNYPAKTQVAASVPAEPPTPWAILLALFGGVLLIFILIYKLNKRDEKADLETWRTFATQHGWRFILHKGTWLSSTPFSMEGELDGANFSMRWHQEGMGKNIQYKTQLSLAIAITTPFQINPRGLLSGLFKRDQIKTGHRLYDCRFLVQTSNASLRPTAAICQRHLAMPAQIQTQEDGLHLTYTGRANKQEAERLVELAKVWASHLNGETVDITYSAEPFASAIPCWIGKIAILAFWFSIASSFPLVFLIRGEETNLPWEIAWTWLSPVGLVAWLVWMFARTVWLQKSIRLVQEILVPLFVGVFILGLAGIWVVAWNAVSGKANSGLVIGIVTSTREVKGKGSSSYFVEFRDIAEQRNVEIQTNLTTYEKSRIGDPVGFELRMGGLGMYHHTNASLDSIRSWLNAKL